MSQDHLDGMAQILYQMKIFKDSPSDAPYDLLQINLINPVEFSPSERSLVSHFLHLISILAREGLVTAGKTNNTEEISKWTQFMQQAQDVSFLWNENALTKGYKSMKSSSNEKDIDSLALPTIPRT